MAELKVRTQPELKNCPQPFNDNENYQKVIRFADEKLKTQLQGYIDHIHARNERVRVENIYSSAKKAMSTANTQEKFQEAARQFETIPDYQDAAALAKECHEKAEVARKDAVLTEGMYHMNRKAAGIPELEAAIEEFQKIPGWKDADHQAQLCQQKIEELKAQAEADRKEAERKAEESKAKAKRNKKIALITTPIVCAIIAFIIVLNAVIIPNGKYNDAIALMDAGKYSEAISAFEALEGYKDSASKITECNTTILDGKYNDAVALMDAGKYIEAISAFEALEEYKDSASKITECNTAILDGKYNDALVLMDEGNLDEAYSIFADLGDYKDAVDKAGNIRLTEQLKNIKVGSYICFGAYEQDNDLSNGKEDVEWLVLEVKDGKALVISKYALDCKQYNTSYTDVTWETCTLRKWLNNDFINAAFSADEKVMIPTVTVSADKHPYYSTNPGRATQDQVFLLSITEVNKYFESGSARKCFPTNYAVANGAYKSCWWWLRSPGFDQDYAALVRNGGDVYEHGDIVTYSSYAVRPALWIDLNS
jgi:tetratricopeptide (TPR) repeat protein